MTTPSQTVGPYLSIGLPWPDGPDVVPDGTPGRDPHPREGASTAPASPSPTRWSRPGRPTRTAGSAPDFRGFGRCPTDDDGEWEILTVKPGALGDGQAPHIDVSVFARGMLNRCVTRIYFADEDNAGDPCSRPSPRTRRATLLAEPGDDGYRFDIHLQGERETVFFASDVFAGVLARGGVAERVSGRAWLQALLDFEVALAHAQASAGVIDDAGPTRSPPCWSELRPRGGRRRAAEIGNPAGPS